MFKGSLSLYEMSAMMQNAYTYEELRMLIPDGLTAFLKQDEENGFVKVRLEVPVWTGNKVKLVCVYGSIFAVPDKETPESIQLREELFNEMYEELMQALDEMFRDF